MNNHITTDLSQGLGTEATDEDLRNLKQSYLLENIINVGHDPNDFAQYIESLKRKPQKSLTGECVADGMNIDNWTFEDLKEVVTRYSGLP